MTTEILEGGAAALQQTMADVLAPLFDAEFPPTAQAPAADAAHSLVEIRGDAEIAFLVTCDRALAIQLARKMRLCGDGEIPEDDTLAETVDELANVLAGNVKCLLPGRTVLTTPRHDTAAPHIAGLSASVGTADGCIAVALGLRRASGD